MFHIILIGMSVYALVALAHIVRTVNVLRKWEAFHREAIEASYDGNVERSDNFVFKAEAQSGEVTRMAEHGLFVTRPFVVLTAIAFFVARTWSLRSFEAQFKS